MDDQALYSFRAMPPNAKKMGRGKPRPIFVAAPTARRRIFTEFLYESNELGDIPFWYGVRRCGLVRSQARIDYEIMLIKAIAGSALILATSQAALAADWQYCLAPSFTQHRIYISAPFPSTMAWGNPDAELDHMLNQSGVSHDNVQCPRANDEASIETMRQEAIAFNRKAGNEIVDLSWTP